MFCPNCGSKNDDDSKFCFNCGVPIKSADAVEPHVETTEKQPAISSDSEIRYTKSVPARDDDNNVIALIGFILSFVVCVPGIVCSAIGLKNAALNGGVRYGFAKAGLIIGIVGTAIAVTMMIILIITVITANVIFFHYWGIYQDLEQTQSVLSQLYILL